MKKQFLTFLVLLLPLWASAYDDEIDGIYYNFNSSELTATVTFKSEYPFNNSAYSGEVKIPDEVVYRGTFYNVISIGENAFYGCDELTSVTIPDGVTTIGKSAFSFVFILYPCLVKEAGNSYLSPWASAFFRKHCKDTKFLGIYIALSPQKIKNNLSRGM